MNKILSPCALHRKKCSISALQNSFRGNQTGRISAFTLAEMMVVMLILSIVLAAMAPVMTTRNKTEQSSPWKYSEGNLSDAYYGLGDSQTAMIGQREFTATDEAAKLIINSSSTRPDQIAFKRNNTNIGVLRMSDNAVMLGSMNAGGNLGTSSVSLGTDTKPDGMDSVSIGRSSQSTGSYSVSVGNLANASATETVAIGDASLASGRGSLSVGAMSQATGSNSIALGIGDDSISISGTEAVGIGYQAVSSGSHSTAVGRLASSTNTNSVALGNSSEASEENSIAIGDSKASALGSIAIGDAARALSDYAVALGLNTEASGSQSIALGYYSTIKGSNSIGIGNNASSDVSNAIVMGTNATVLRGGGIAIGNNAYSGATNSTLYGDNAVAIGSGAKMGNDYGVALGNNSGHTNKGTYGVAIGYNACSNVTGSNKVCIGANSGPKSGSTWATDDTERIFIGSKSKFNDGAAVLEVHNTGKTVYAHDNKKYVAKDSSVVINGNLIVKGVISSWIIDRYGNNVSGYRVLERHKEGEDNASLRYSMESGLGFDDYFSDGGSGFSSDRHLKYVSGENRSGLEKIRELKVFNYTFKKDKKKTPHVGVMAQDLQKIFPDAVKKGADGFLTIRMEDMFYAVINAIKELDAKVAAQDKKIKELEARIEKLEAKIK